MKKKFNLSIGILGGTFDPIHLGHLHLAKEVLRKLKLTHIYFLPCFKSAYQKKIQANPGQRLAMLKLALAPYKKLSTDDRELKKRGVSYTIDTLKSLRRDFPDTPLCLIMGKDAFLKFTTWHKWREIPNLAHLIIADRSETRQDKPISQEQTTFAADFIPTQAEIQKIIPAQEKDLCNLINTRYTHDKKIIRQELAGSILFLSINPLLISATEIRAAVKTGKNIKEFLPNQVRQYIHENHLYSRTKKHD